MNIFSIKRKNLILLFAILLICAFLYLSYSVSQIEQEDFNKKKVTNQKVSTEFLVPLEIS